MPIDLLARLLDDIPNLDRGRAGRLALQLQAEASANPQAWTAVAAQARAAAERHRAEASRLLMLADLIDVAVVQASDGRP